MSQYWTYRLPYHKGLLPGITPNENLQTKTPNKDLTLDGLTPADKAGIKIKGNNKWITLIQNASHPN